MNVVFVTTLLFKENVKSKGFLSFSRVRPASSYLYAVIGWKFIIGEFKYGFGGAPNWEGGATFLDWVLLHWERGLGGGPEAIEDWTSGGTPVSFMCVLEVLSKWR